MGEAVHSHFPSVKAEALGAGLPVGKEVAFTR